MPKPIKTRIVSFTISFIAAMHIITKKKKSKVKQISLRFAHQSKHKWKIKNHKAKLNTTISLFYIYCRFHSVETKLKKIYSHTPTQTYT